MKSGKFIGFLFFGLFSASIALTAPQLPSVHPWQSVATGYDSTVRHGRIVGVPPPPDDPTSFFSLVENTVLTMTADNGGLSRSVVLPQPGSTVGLTSPGKWWENVNGGPGYANSHCGGYSSSDCVETLFPGVILGGPPSSVDEGGDYGVPNGKVDASGGWPDMPSSVQTLLAAKPDLCIAPDGSHRCAGGIVYRIASDGGLPDGRGQLGVSGLFASPDAGRQWYPLAPQCAINSPVYISSMAVDSGRPGHLVVFNSSGDEQDAGGCELNPAMPCQIRPIASTADVGPQLFHSFLAAKGLDSPYFGLDSSGGPSGSDWRYAGIAHLATNHLFSTSGDFSTANETSCNVLHLLGSDNPPGLRDSCPMQVADPKLSICHSGPPGIDGHLSQFCPDKQAPFCQCTPANPPASPSGCDQPKVSSLAIDPRNGQALASSNTGVLFSPDGGRKWHRRGQTLYTRYSQSAPSGELAVTEEPLASPGDAPSSQGIRLLTMQGLEFPVATVDEAALDLNAQPAYILDVGKITFAMEPCTAADFPNASDYTSGSADVATAKPGEPVFARKRGHLTGTVAVVWRNPLRPAQVMSGVFVAAADTCDPNNDAHVNDPLVFRDSTSVLPAADANSLGDR